MFEGSHTAEAVSLKIQEILERFLIKNKVKFIISDSAANMVRGKQFYRVIFATSWLLILGMRNLNDLRAKDLAKDEAMEDDSGATVDLSPDEEVAQTLEEVAAVEAILKELDVLYKNSLYIRIGCLSHKVSLY